jgi:hypothetical protein
MFSLTVWGDSMTDLIVTRNDNRNNGNENSNDEHTNECVPYEGESTCCKIKRVDVSDSCGQYFSFDLSKVPIINIYMATGCENTIVILLEFINNKQYKFYTNRVNRKNKHVQAVFLNNQTFTQFIEDLGLDYNVGLYL